MNDKSQTETNAKPMKPEISPGQIACPHCSLPLEPAAQDCPACRSRLDIVIFPAFSRPPEAVSTASGERALEGEAVCFFHAEKRADVACERCGRFLCALCDLPLAGRHLCPACCDAQKLPELIATRWVGGEAAAWLGLVPLLGCAPFWVMWPFTGSAAIFLALWTWRKPGSLVHGSRHGLAVCGLLGGLAQLAATGAFIFAMIYAIRES